MKIFSAAQIREWDAYTIANEPVASIDLMERAATACFSWINEHFRYENNLIIFCGTGNNGGDGLAIARMMIETGKNVTIYILEGRKRTADFSTNLARLQQREVPIYFLGNEHAPVFPKEALLIDALFGTGLNGPLQGFAAKLVTYLNQQGNTIISIDIPSGLSTDAHSEGDFIINANYTLSFQSPKLAFFMADNGKYTGDIHLLEIGLSAAFYEATAAKYCTTGLKEATAFYKPRNKFLHKYNLGHALLYAGSENMMGAAVLCAKACLRSGAGLVTVHMEAGSQVVMQTAFPEAISSTEDDVQILSQKKAAIGIGPGLDLRSDNEALLTYLCSKWQGGLVIDATALRLLINKKKALSSRLSHPAILTPHTGEFDKLFGSSANDFERLEKAQMNSRELNCYIILKGPNTLVACPDGNSYFNTSGNAGLATAGSGDVLTGILTGLLSQGYDEQSACILGVYLHGLAGDLAAEKRSQESMIASDIIEYLGDAFKEIRNAKSAGVER